MMTVLERRPRYLPEGYTLRYLVAGGKEPGLGWAEEQVVLMYTRGWSREDFSMPLMVCVGGVGVPDLIGTSPAHAAPVDLGPGVAGEYHDGILTARLDELRDFAGTAWQQGEAHSVTARSAAGTFAVRGPRSLPLDELRAVILSMSPGG